jgi:hypothetical protein
VPVHAPGVQLLRKQVCRKNTIILRAVITARRLAGAQGSCITTLNQCACCYCSSHTPVMAFFSVAQQPNLNLGRLIVEVSRPPTEDTHTNTPSRNPLNEWSGRRNTQHTTNTKYDSLLYCSNSCTSLHFKILKSHTRTHKIHPYILSVLVWDFSILKCSACVGTIKKKLKQHARYKN